MIGAWNVRGLNKPRRKKEVKKWITSNSSHFVCLFETRVRAVSFDIISKKVMPSWSWADNYVAHGLGRIWIGWNAAILSVVVLDVQAQCMLLQVTILHSGEIIFCTPVYAANRAVDRKALWSYITHYSILANGPWITLGDWNAIRFHGDKKGGKRVPQKLLDEFSNCLHTANLLKIYATNGEWSWSNRQRTTRRICVKLDRVFLNNQWLDQIPGTKMAFSAAKSSDHYGVVVQVSKTFAAGPEPFKMLKLWCLKETVLPIIEQAWKIEGKGVLKSTQKLEDIQLQLLSNSSEDLFEAEYKIREEYQASMTDQEILLAQKARTLWLRENDRCSAFFHH
ncbi:uncharacterized protein LOC132304831 [Cornus florida]|uniref:uncharacterized protein LOC132304831 n=1 Tax=Cornus florida TaxID=4283 RepID=UPI00289CCFE7|nr:uncharacterized protein LOC132304831 [Cornus florida]